ncbi:hypothetical protein BASA81_005507 [Batrachochytrium salamandrivorans]|nr:hypothetical protein BASA81_005507 [Batrachochytrium salamandrivorans]
MPSPTLVCLVVLACLMGLCTAQQKVNENFGDIVSAVQNENRLYIASSLGRIGSFWFTELKFDWSFAVPNPHNRPKHVLVTSLWYRKNILLSIGKHAVYGWNARNSAKIWGFEPPHPDTTVLEAIFIDDNTVVITTSDFLVHELDKQTGEVKRKFEVSKDAIKYSVLLNDEDGTKDLIQSFADGRISVSSLNAKPNEPARKEFKSSDPEFALVQNDGYLVHKKDTNRIVFIHVNSGGNLPPHYFGENIINLRSDHASQSVLFTGKKTKPSVVVRVVNDTLQEWKIGQGKEYTIHNPSNSAWVSDPKKAVVKFNGPSNQQSMPSEGDKTFKRAWNVQGDRKTLLFTVGMDGLLGLWRHIEGFNRLQELWLLPQGPQQAEKQAEKRADTEPASKQEL